MKPLLLLFNIRSRLVFIVYTTLFVLIVTAWTFFVLASLYVFLFLCIDEISERLDRHAIIEHQCPSPITSAIDEQSVWKASGRVFFYTVQRMGELMEETRPDIAKRFFDSIDQAPGETGLDMRDFPLIDKEYILIILTTFRQELADERRTEFDKYTFPCCESPKALFYEVSEKRLADFEALLQRSIDRLRYCSSCVSNPETSSKENPNHNDNQHCVEK